MTVPRETPTVSALFLLIFLRACNSCSRKSITAGFNCTSSFYNNDPFYHPNIPIPNLPSKLISVFSSIYSWSHSKYLPEYDWSDAWEDNIDKFTCTPQLWLSLIVLCYLALLHQGQQQVCQSCSHSASGSSMHLMEKDRHILNFKTLDKQIK